MKLCFDNISKQYGKQCVIDGFQATLTDGIYGLLGPNGAGKTTLINIMLGILEADQGTVFLDEKDIRQMGSKYFDNVGYLPQYPMFYRNFRIDEFLKYMCVLKNISVRQRKERIEEVLELVNLTDCYKKKIGTLSGGMRQRLGIAQAILNKPKILVLDEPTSGLDPGERIRFRNLISRISKDKFVLLATHIVSDVEYIATEIIILKKGKLKAKGFVEDLTNNISGKVWNVVSCKNEMEDLMERYKVANVKRMEDKYQLRIVCEKKPTENAIPTEPALEDVFLSIVNNFG